MARALSTLAIMSVGIVPICCFNTKAKLPTHTAVKDYKGLDKDSIILLEQIRTIDKQRLNPLTALHLAL